MTTKKANYDVIIIGGGPGGLSAALWCSELGLSAILLEKETEFGGQLLLTFNAINNYLGAVAANGRELRECFLEHVKNAKVEKLNAAEVFKADLVEKSVILADGTTISGSSIIIATGVQRRKLGIRGEVEFYGKGILESGEKAKNAVAGKRVVIVGGGDAAVENAIILGRTAEKVFVVHRRGEFSARNDFVVRATALENVEFVADSRLTAIIGNEQVTGVDIQDNLTGATLHIETDTVLIRIGVEPNTDLFRGQIALDKNGYIAIDANCSTNLKGVFAIGDVASPASPTISTAAGHGATAAKAALEFLRV